MFQYFATRTRNSFIMEEMEPPIAIIGAGRVGCAFLIALTERGAPVKFIASRDPAHAQAAAQRTIGVKAIDLTEIPLNANRILIAVSDLAIPDVARQLNRAGMNHGAV